MYQNEVFNVLSAFEIFWFASKKGKTVKWCIQHFRLYCTNEVLISGYSTEVGTTEALKRKRCVVAVLIRHDDSKSWGNKNPC